MFKFILFYFITFFLNCMCYEYDHASFDNYKDDFQVEPYGLLEDTINKTLQSLKDNITEPIIIDFFEINPSGNILSGGANISGLTITGPKGFLVPYLQIKLLSLQLDFTIAFPSININTKYWADLLIANLIPVYGSGKTNINFSNITVNGSGKVGLSNGINIETLTVFITIGEAVFDFHGLLDNEEFSLIVNTILNDVVAKFINEHQDLISNIISPIIKNIMNGILHPDNTTNTTIY